MPFDSLADITPIMVVGTTPLVLVVNPTKLPVKDVKELIAALKAKPDAYNYASSGNGTILHLAAEMFLDQAGATSNARSLQGRRRRWSPTSWAARSTGACVRCRRCRVI